MTDMRRGACPSLSAPMPTGDGLLVRLGLPERRASPVQLRQIAEAAAQYGNGILEITRRGNLQVRGLSTESVGFFEATVLDLGLASEPGVPIEIGPLAGIDPTEIVDARPLAGRFRRTLAERGVAARLGPKVSVAIDGGGRLHLGQVSADVRLVALSSASGPVWELAIAGTALSAERLGQVADANAVECVSLILAALAEKGPQARARDIGGAEIKKRLGQRLTPLRRGLQPVRDVQAVGLHDLAEHGFAVGLAAPFGQLRAEQIIEVSAAGEGCVTDFRLCPDHTLLAMVKPPAVRVWRGQALGLGEAAPPYREQLEIKRGCANRTTEGLTRASTISPARHVKASVDGRDEPGHDAGESLEYARYVQAEAARVGFIVDPRDPRRAVAACPGAPACASGYMPARQLAEAIAASAADLLDGSFTLHVSGCAKGCAHPASAALTLIGDAEDCSLVVAGNAGGGPQARVGHDRAAAGFARLTGLVRSERLAGEGTAACLDRLGERRLATAFAGAR